MPTTTLLNQHAAGDPTAFAELLNSRYSAIAAIVSRHRPIHYDSGENQDFLHDVLVRLLDARASLRPSEGSHFRALIRRLSRFECCDQQRRMLSLKRGQGQVAARLLFEDTPHGPTSPEEPALSALARRDLIERINAALHGLSERDLFLVKRRTQGMSFDSIASDIGITGEGARKQYARAIRRLRKRLSSEHPTVA